MKTKEELIQLEKNSRNLAMTLESQITPILENEDLVVIVRSLQLLLSGFAVTALEFLPEDKRTRFIEGFGEDLQLIVHGLNEKHLQSKESK